MHHGTGDNLLSGLFGSVAALLYNILANHVFQSVLEAFFLGVAGAAGGLILKYTVQFIKKKIQKLKTKKKQ